MAQNKIIALLKKTTADVKKEIQNIENKISEIAYDSEIIAKNTILIGASLPSFTQKHGDELEQYIELKKLKNGNYELIAGEFADNEIRYELYYAEYGAGLEKTKSTIASSYKPTGETRYFKTKKEFWIYPLVSTEYVVTPNGRDGYRNYGITDRSTPLHYMETARNYAKEKLKTLKIKTKSKIKTTIKRGAKNVSEK